MSSSKAISLQKWQSVSTAWSNL